MNCLPALCQTLLGGGGDVCYNFEKLFYILLYSDKIKEIFSKRDEDILWKGSWMKRELIVALTAVILNKPQY
jgi:hypothetical protein